MFGDFWYRWVVATTNARFIYVGYAFAFFVCFLKDQHVYGVAASMFVFI